MVDILLRYNTSVNMIDGRKANVLDYCAEQGIMILFEY